MGSLLGETVNGYYKDGTKAYAEQISVSPHLAFFSLYGPNEDYIYHGYYEPMAKASINGGMV